MFLCSFTLLSAKETYDVVWSQNATRYWNLTRDFSDANPSIQANS